MPRNAAKSLHILWVGKERRCQREIGRVREGEGERRREREGSLVAVNGFALRRLRLIFFTFYFFFPLSSYV